MKRFKNVVLVVDDDASVRNFLALLMKDRGWSVLLAADGHQGLEVSDAYPGDIHLLLSDVNMPRMNGCDLARQILSDRPAIRVLMLSGIEQPTSGLPFLRKPFLPQDLWRKLEHVFSAPPCDRPAAPCAA